MNYISMCFIVIVLYNFCTLYGMDEKKIVLYQYIREHDIPVLCVNNYIIPMTNAYRALEKESFLLNAYLRNIRCGSVKQKIKHHRMLECIYPKVLSNEQLFIMERENCLSHDIDYAVMLARDRLPCSVIDFADIQHVSEEVRVCLCNIFCGMGMIGVLLIIAFCK